MAADELPPVLLSLLGELVRIGRMEFNEDNLTLPAALEREGLARNVGMSAGSGLCFEATSEGRRVAASMAAQSTK